MTPWAIDSKMTKKRFPLDEIQYFSKSEITLREILCF